MSNGKHDVNANRQHLKTAAEWLVRLQNPDLPPRELLCWERWIEEDPRQPLLIQTVWGVGYKFAEQEGEP